MDTIKVILGAGLSIMVLVMIMAAPVMWLWDWLMPELFGLGEITLWQSLGLLFLCRILFTNSESK